jgi:hypothetical protein
MVFSLRFWPSFLKTNCLFKKKKKAPQHFQKEEERERGDNRGACCLPRLEATLPGPPTLPLACAPPNRNN